MTGGRRRNPRVCLTMWAPGEGGLQAKAATVYRYLTARGFSVTLLYLSKPLSVRNLPAWMWNGGIRTEEWMQMPAIAVDYMAHVEVLHYLVPALRVRRLLREFDILLATRGANLGEAFFALNGCRFIDWVSTTISDERRRQIWRLPDTRPSSRFLDRVNRLLFPLLIQQEAWMFRRAARILAVSAYTARLITETYRIPLESVETVYDPVDTEVFRPGRSGGSALRGPYLLWVGRLDDPRKNLGLLFNAFSGMHRKRGDVQLVLVGPTADPDMVHTEARRYGVDSAVTYVGTVSRSRLVELYQGAEALVLSSQQEAFGRVLAEAMACGTPVISTRCGGPDEVVRDGETGLLVPLDNPERLADAMQWLTTDRSFRDRLGRTAREHAVLNFAAEVVGDHLVQAMTRVYPELFT